MPEKNRIEISFISDEELAILTSLYEVNYKQLKFAEENHQEDFYNLKKKQCDVLAKVINIHSKQRDALRKQIDKINDSNKSPSFTPWKDARKQINDSNKSPSFTPWKDARKHNTNRW